MAADATLGLILFGHGARDSKWARPFFRLRDMLLARSPNTPVELAFLDHMQPDLVTAVGRLADRGVQRITVVPLFMAQGEHLRRDLPQIVATACGANPGVLVRTVAAIGEVEELLEAIAGWVLREHDCTGRAELGNPIA